MQRLIESTLIAKLLNKYQDRYNECEQKWEDDIEQLKTLSEKQNIEGLQCTENEHKSFLVDDIASLNSQLSAYECIIKDLKELIK